MSMAKSSEAVDLAARPASDLTKAEAQRLTDKIRSTLEKAWPLVLEAYERKAWAALGYGSFKQYIETELSISRGQGYRLVDQGKLIRELEKVTGTTVDVTIREATALRDDVQGTAAAVAKAVKGKRSTRQSTAKTVVSDRAAAVIEARATEKLTRDPQPDDQRVRGETSRARDTSDHPRDTPVRRRVAEAFPTDVETAIDAVLDCKPTEARAVPVAKLAELRRWLEQAQAVHAPEREAATGWPENGCTHKDKAGRETVNKLPYAVICTQCGAKVR